MAQAFRRSASSLLKRLEAASLTPCVTSSVTRSLSVCSKKYGGSCSNHENILNTPPSHECAPCCRPTQAALSPSGSKLANASAWPLLGGILALGFAGQGLSSLAEAPLEPQREEIAADLDEEAKYVRSKEKRGLPKDIVLYQYEVCPFCNKVRAFLDFHKVPYRTVEVNPLTKAQLKWSQYKKVPVVLLDEDIINDSSIILSRLAVECETQQPRPAARSWFFGAKRDTESDEEAEGEEIKWRRWVDKNFVQLLTVNIYRSLRESWQTFDYIAEHANFSFAEKQAARVAGSGLMYVISGRLIKKYGIAGDLRQALYAGAEEWVVGIGPERDFMGGDKPNLADLSMFGVIRSITGTQTFQDLLHNTDISRWYERMMSAVGPSSRLPS